MLIQMSGRKDKSIASSRLVQSSRHSKPESSLQEVTLMIQATMVKDRCLRLIFHQRSRSKTFFMIHMLNHHPQTWFWILIKWVYRIMYKCHRCHNKFHQWMTLLVRLEVDINQLSNLVCSNQE